VKLSSPDYRGKMTEEEAKQDFLKRIENYKIQYEPLNEELDDELSYIKVYLTQARTQKKVPLYLYIN
jgi:hypothetical protein